MLDFDTLFVFVVFKERLVINVVVLFYGNDKCA